MSIQAGNDPSSVIWNANFPHSIGHTPKAVYRWTDGVDFNIAPLDLGHVVRFDVPLGGPPSPSITLTLPIMSALPKQSRGYFFYVEDIKTDSTLTFVPVLGSGDTINNDPFSAVFNWPVSPNASNSALLLCVGFKGNYIIREFFGRTSGEIPTEIYGVEAALTALPQADAPTGSIDVYPTFIDPPYSVVPDITPNFSYTPAMPGNGLPGFLCNVSGFYSFTTNIVCFIKQVAIAREPYGAYFGNILEFDPLGTFLLTQDRVSPSAGGVRPQPLPPNYDYHALHSSQSFVPCVAGNYYAFSITLDNPDGTPASVTATLFTSNQNKVTIQYWGPLLTPRPLARSISAGISAFYETAAGSEVPPPPKAPLFYMSDKDAASQVRALQSGQLEQRRMESKIKKTSASSSSASSNNVSLGDLESIVRRMMQQQQQWATAASAASSVPSAASLAAQQQAVNRKRAAEVEVEGPSAPSAAKRAKK